MKIKLLTSISGPAFSYAYGEEVDMPDATAKRLIERGQAQPVRDVRDEMATDVRAETAETTTAPKRSRKSRR